MLISKGNYIGVDVQFIYNFTSTSTLYIGDNGVCSSP